MHRVLIRFKVIRNDFIFEAYLDERLSFEENFRMLESIMEERIGSCRVFDPNKRIFLAMNIPLSEFNIETFMSFYLF